MYIIGINLRVVAEIKIDKDRQRTLRAGPTTGNTNNAKDREAYLLSLFALVRMKRMDKVSPSMVLYILC